MAKSKGGERFFKGLRGESEKEQSSGNDDQRGEKSLPQGKLAAVGVELAQPQTDTPEKEEEKQQIGRKPQVHEKHMGGKGTDPADPVADRARSPPVKDHRI